MTLPTLILAAFLRWHPDAGTADRIRYVEIADAIADEAHEAPLWTTAPAAEEPPAGEVATGLLLASIAQHESGLLQSVRTCKRRGDGGRSIGLYQVMRGSSWGGHAASEICRSDRLQAHLALAVLRLAHERSPSLGFVLRAYASGDGGHDTAAARQMIAMALATWARAGITMTGDAPVWS